MNPPLDIFLSEKHLAIQETARAFADSEIRSVAGALDEREGFPDDLYERMAQTGFFGVSLPREDGGVGADTLAYALVMEEISRGYSALADELGNVELVGSLLATHGTPEQKARYRSEERRVGKECRSRLST